jgi:predicted nuclease of predicted toxin-antitoxin system
MQQEADMVATGTSIGARVQQSYKNKTGSWISSPSFSDDTVIITEEKQILHDRSYTSQQPSKVLLLLLLGHPLADLLRRVEDA